LFFGKAKFDIFNILKNNIIGVESSKVLWYLFFILFFMFGKGGGQGLGPQTWVPKE
jgi:hypothetical protein